MDEFSQMVCFSIEQESNPVSFSHNFRCYQHFADTSNSFSMRSFEYYSLFIISFWQKTQSFYDEHPINLKKFFNKFILFYKSYKLTHEIISFQQMQNLEYVEICFINIIEVSTYNYIISGAHVF